MNNLTSKSCQPCEGIGDSLSQEEVKKMLQEVSEWEIDEKSSSIKRMWKFKDFKEALMFVNEVGELAEKENHHPDIFLHKYRKMISSWLQRSTNYPIPSNHGTLATAVTMMTESRKA